MGERELWQIAVDEHNKYRRRHGVPDIKGNDEAIHKKAQNYAQYLASYDLFQHSQNSGYGENLAGALGDDKPAAIRYAVKMWYDEIKSYNYGNPGFSMGTGHFTQVVWKSSTHVGIGVAYNSRKRWWIVVANYSPPGNYQGRFRENVPRLLSADEIRRVEEERSPKKANVEKPNDDGKKQKSKSDSESDSETRFSEHFEKHLAELREEMALAHDDFMKRATVNQQQFLSMQEVVNSCDNFSARQFGGKSFSSMTRKFDSTDSIIIEMRKINT